MKTIQIIIAILIISLLAACSSSLITPSSYDEASSGDLSNDFTQPSPLNFSTGTFKVAGTTGPGDRDYFSFVIPEGAVLSRLNLTKYESLDSLAFIGFEAGNALTFNPDTDDIAEASKLLAYTLFGGAQLNQNLLNSMTVREGESISPLTAGEYSFWVQQTGIETNYELSFTIE